MELKLLGAISFTNAVPAKLPSVLHNSLPLIPLLATNKTVELRDIKLLGLEDESAVAKISFTKTVPAAVPFDFQSS